MTVDTALAVADRAMSRFTGPVAQATGLGGRRPAVGLRFAKAFRTV